MAPLPAADQRHPWLRYQIEEYTEGIRHSYEQRLETIWSRPVFVSHAWRRLFGIRAPLVCEFMLEFLSTYRISDTEMGLDVADMLCFQLGGVRRRMTWRQFILVLGLHTEQEMAEAGGQAPEKVTGVDLFYLRSMDRRTTNVPRLLAQSLFRHAKGRKSEARLSKGHFIGRLAMHFGLVSDEGLRGLQAAAAGAYEAGPTTKEGAQEIPAPAQAPRPPPPAPQPQTMSQRIERIEEGMHKLRFDVVGLRGFVESFTTEQSRVSTWLITCMTQLMDASGLTYQAFDSTLVSSSRMPYQRRVRPRIGDASTSAAPHADDQPDP
ncbi:hypothetical protein Tco_1462598, partial [Tanacetum coccineum]